MCCPFEGSIKLRASTAVWSCAQTRGIHDVDKWAPGRGYRARTRCQLRVWCSDRICGARASSDLIQTAALAVKYVPLVPVSEYVTIASDVTYTAPAPVTKNVAAPVIEFVIQALAVTCEANVASSPAVAHEAPALL